MVRQAHHRWFDTSTTGSVQAFRQAQGKQAHHRWLNPSSVLLEGVAASVGGERFRFSPWILSAIQRANSINNAVRLAIGGMFQKGTNIRQFAAGAAMQAPAFAVFGNRQNGSKSPFYLVNHSTRTGNPLPSFAEPTPPK